MLYIFRKLKREILRVINQLIELPVTISTYFFGALYYDFFLSKKVIISKGVLNVKNKIAIYVIYPEFGLLPSHITSINYISSNGFTPLIISNIKLKKFELIKLKEICWFIIERPNFGYDFGAYREGILFINHLINKIESVVLINDSCWFPLRKENNWLLQAESIGADFVGAASNYGIERKVGRDYKCLNFYYSHTHKNFHYCSFALYIKNKILNDKIFFKFWKKFPLTNRKNRTVRRGEIGLSKFIISSGYSHAETLDIKKLEEKLYEFDGDFVKKIFDYLIIPQDKILSDTKIKIILKESKEPHKVKDDHIKFILATVALIGISYALPYYNIFSKKSSFLKKSPVWLNEECLKTVLNIIKEIDNHICMQIKEEINLLKKNNKIKF
tara:strand:- start:679 stop:1836 length:1158 start_codon:yes stop_codon:yes gene_type:complete